MRVSAKIVEVKKKTQKDKAVFMLFMLCFCTIGEQGLPHLPRFFVLLIEFT